MWKRQLPAPRRCASRSPRVIFAGPEGYARSSEKVIAVAPGGATNRFAIPMPEDVVHGWSVLSAVKSGGPSWIRTNDQPVMSRPL